MPVNIPKQRFAAVVIKQLQAMAEVMDDADALKGEYIDLGYATTDPITLDDLGAMNVSPEQLAAGIALLGQYIVLMDTGDNQKTANSLRRAGS